MSNATAKVNKGALRVQDEFRKRPWNTLTAALQIYTGGMLGRTSTGYLAKFDDTQAMTFVGLVRGDNGDPKLPISTNGDGTADVDYWKTQAFELAISGVAITDIGRQVYALDDWHGTTDPSATVYANRVGIIEDYLAAGIALVSPSYTVANGAALQVFAANGAVQLKTSNVIISKGSAAALTIADPTSGSMDGMEIQIISTTAFAHTLVAPSGFNASGTTATFGASKGNNIDIMAFGGKWYVLGSTGITLS